LTSSSFFHSDATFFTNSGYQSTVFPIVLQAMQILFAKEKLFS